ncbi:MAG: NADH-flavin reductase [Acidimicrobiales bacterium]|nr:NADH-flavin reductase [Acidimicrobiales bacterium]
MARSNLGCHIPTGWLVLWVFDKHDVEAPKMKLTVFGATGGTGVKVIEQGLAAGHEVRAVVRDATRLAPQRPGLEVVVADVMDPAAIVDAVTDRDAVISAMGSRDGRRPTTVCADSARSIVTAMHRAGTSRLVVVSGTGPFDEGEGPGMRYVLKPIGRRFLKHVFADFVEMEKVVRASGLDWTIVRPPRLTDKPFTGRYRTRRDLNMPRNLSVSRGDLAHLILAACADRDSYDAAIYIAS